MNEQNVLCVFFSYCCLSCLSGQQKPRSDGLGQVNFVLKILKIEVQLPGEQVIHICFSSLTSLNKNVSLVNDNFQSEATSKLKTATLVNH